MGTACDDARAARQRDRYALHDSATDSKRKRRYCLEEPLRQWGRPWLALVHPQTTCKAPLTAQPRNMYLICILVGKHTAWLLPFTCAPSTAPALHVCTQHKACMVLLLRYRDTGLSLNALQSCNTRAAFCILVVCPALVVHRRMLEGQDREGQGFVVCWPEAECPAKLKKLDLQCISRIDHVCPVLQAWCAGLRLMALHSWKKLDPSCTSTTDHIALVFRCTGTSGRSWMGGARPLWCVPWWRALSHPGCWRSRWGRAHTARADQVCEQLTGVGDLQNTAGTVWCGMRTQQRASPVCEDPYQERAAAISSAEQGLADETGEHGAWADLHGATVGPVHGVASGPKGLSYAGGS